MKVLLDHFKYKCHSSLKVKADFLVVLDKLAKKNNMDEKEMVKIIKKKVRWTVCKYKFKYFGFRKIVCAVS